MGNYWDFERFGEDIKRTVQNAVDSKDFRRLNETIKDTINSAVDSLTGGMGDAPGTGRRWGRQRNGGREQSWTYGDRTQEKRTRKKQAWEKQRDRKPGFSGVDLSTLAIPALYKKTGGRRAVGMALAAAGYGIGGAFLFALLITAMTGAFIGFGTEMALGVSLLSVCTVLFGSMAAVGTRMLRQLKRFRMYVEKLEGKDYCNLDELSVRTGKKEKFLIKDLKRMIEKGWFVQGHMDEQNTCLMTSDKAYGEYRELMRRQEEQKRTQDMKKEKADAERRMREKEKAEKYGEMDSQIQGVIAAGNEYIRKIRACNDAIPGEAVSAKIYRMEILTRRIFERVEQDPDAVSDIRKMMEYYLPTAVKLLEAYRELDAQPVQGENILSSKKEIEDTLDTLNTAFEKLLDDLFQETAWDVSADISVLRTMLKQEGLTDSDFETGGK